MLLFIISTIFCFYDNVVNIGTSKGKNLVLVCMKLHLLKPAIVVERYCSIRIFILENCLTLYLCLSHLLNRFKLLIDNTRYKWVIKELYTTVSALVFFSQNFCIGLYSIDIYIYIMVLHSL